MHYRVKTSPKKISGVGQMCPLGGSKFLAAMSSSRSDVVTQCFRPCFLLVSLNFLLVLKSFNGVSRQFKECLKFNGSFKAVSRKF